jgi:ABC-2 type transport system ATP-binding protein
VGLTRRFGPVTAVAGLDLTVSRGEIFGLVGPDGAGKTTVMRLLCGLLNPDGGQVTVGGRDVSSDPAGVRDRIGYMPQRFGLYLDLTVEENLDFYADLFGVGDPLRGELTERLLRMTRMSAFRRRPAGQLSGGMKQKLGLMCALLHQPEVLFLDEPTNGVDPISRRDFWVILYELVKGGLTVVLSTAYLDEAERCNRVGLMYRGRLAACDSPGKLGRHVEEPCVAVRTSDQRRARELLQTTPGILAVIPAGAWLHVFATPELVETEELGRRLAGLDPVEVEPIRPSVEDLFIALVRKQELRHGHARG